MWHWALPPAGPHWMLSMHHPPAVERGENPDTPVDAVQLDLRAAAADPAVDRSTSHMAPHKRHSEIARNTAMDSAGVQFGVAAVGYRKRNRSVHRVQRDRRGSLQL